MDNCAIFRELPLIFIEGELCLFFANFAEKKNILKQEILVQFRNNIFRCSIPVMSYTQLSRELSRYILMGNILDESYTYNVFSFQGCHSLNHKHSFRNNTNFSSSNECEYCFVCKKIKKVSGSGEKHSPLKVKWSVPYGKHVMIRIRNMNHLTYLCQECLWFNEWQPWNENTLSVYAETFFIFLHTKQYSHSFELEKLVLFLNCTKISCFKMFFFSAKLAKNKHSSPSIKLSGSSLNI
jgi:hypothetical protein